MKVCLISGEYPPQIGGLADYTAHLAGALTQQGHAVHVLTSKKAEPGRSDDVGEEAPPPTAGPTVHPLATRWGFELLPVLRRALDQLGPDVVHIQYQTAAYRMHPAIMLAPRWLRWRRPQLRCITTFHDLRDPYLFPKAGPLRRRATEAFLLSNAAAIFTNPDDTAAAREVKARAERDDGEPPFVVEIPIGANIEPGEGRKPMSREELAAHYGVPADGYLLGYFGLANHSKGIETLLAALAVLRTRGLRVHLLMLGETVGASDPTNRAYLQQLQALVQRLALEQQVTWTGYLPPEALSRALLALDCCVLPYADGASYRRGTLLAALAHGLPVVTTQPAGIAENGWLPALTDAQHCCLVPPQSPAALADALSQLLPDAALRARLSAGALDLSQHFWWERIARQTVNVYQRVLQQHVEAQTIHG